VYDETGLRKEISRVVDILEDGERITSGLKSDIPHTEGFLLRIVLKKP